MVFVHALSHGVDYAMKNMTLKGMSIDL